MAGGPSKLIRSVDTPWEKNIDNFVSPLQRLPPSTNKTLRFPFSGFWRLDFGNVPYHLFSTSFLLQLVCTRNYRFCVITTEVNRGLLSCLNTGLPLLPRLETAAAEFQINDAIFFLLVILAETNTNR